MTSTGKHLKDALTPHFERKNVSVRMLGVLMQVEIRIPYQMDPGVRGEAEAKAREKAEEAVKPVIAENPWLTSERFQLIIKSQ